MQFRGIIFVLLTGTAMSAPAQSQRGPAAPAPQIHATLAQLMKGVMYPSSNVFFSAQSKNPADVPPAKQPSAATDPLASVFGKWEAVENSALAIVESANLLIVPGRKCSNGLDVPIANADWPKLVQELRDAGMAGYKAAQSKNQDKILEAADIMAASCSNCHEKYRNKPNLASRCK